MNRISLTTAGQERFDAWLFPVSNPKATVHILHGMAEHCLRYQPFAVFLQQAGYQVVTHNHRGHGGRLPAGHFADPQQNGWQRLMDDIQQVQQAVCATEPLFLLGHSMGSFIAQGYAIRHGERLSGLILSGSDRQPAPMIYAGLAVAHLLRQVQGPRHLSALMNQLSFGAFNRHFRPDRTAFDWLSRDRHQVDNYIADPLCGHLCSLQLWIDLLGGLREIGQPQNIAAIPAGLPVYLFGGDQDPVGRIGKGLPALAQHFLRTGHTDVTVKLYTGGRHEMLNESNAGEVFHDTLNWLNSRLPPSGN